MKVPEGFKRWVRFGPTIPEMPSCIDRTVIVQKAGARVICASCPLREPGFEPKGCFDVPDGEKADLGSEAAGLKTWNGRPVCCHMGERAIVSDCLPELKVKFED